jgi:hypothetical protein
MKANWRCWHENLIKQARSMLVVTPDRWHSLSQALPADLLRRRPAPGEWSAVECLQHIIDAERVFQFRVKCFLEGADFPAFNPDQEGTDPGERSPAELARELEGLRSKSLEMLETIGDVDLDRRVRHQELGPVRLGEMLSEWAAHDLNHTIQAERALMQPYLAECGPWIVYFKDHLLSET